MANTFFDFDTSLNNGDNVLPPDDEDCLENEEEYDALNDETFGTLEDASSLDDWEQQHEQFAEIEESTKQTEKLENSISQLVLSDYDNSLSTSSLSNSVWSYTPSNKNGDIFNSSILSSLQKASKSFIEIHSDNSSKSILNLRPSEHLPALPAQPKKICTVEELEKNLLKTSKQASGSSASSISSQLPPPQQQLQQQPVPLVRPISMPPNIHQPGPAFHPMLQHQITNARLPPPGLPPINIPPPGMRHLPPHLNPHQMLPPGLVRIMPPHPQFMQNKGPPLPPGFMYPPGSQNQFPVNLPFNFPVPSRHPNMPQMTHNQQRPNQQQQIYHNAQQHHPRSRHDSSSYNRQYKDKDEPKDEYAELMSMREKQWLLNIQMLQLNTGMPYFDDYYYTVFKERKAKNNKESSTEKTPPHLNKRQHRNSDRQENQNPLTPRVYTPLQFENSLGKLQCGSVTAPRKIIDMDIVTPDKDSDNSQVSSRDSRKTKQLLIELEALYALLLKAEDINNPLYTSNMEKLREMKQKQRLRELELAPTPEQKQEVLRLFKLESEPVVEHQYDYIIKLVQGLLQDEKFSSFLNIRKGKMLVLRLLPHLMEGYSSQLLELWSKILLSLPIVGRRDTAGDNILPKYYPFFKRYIQTCSLADILEIVAGLVEIVRQDSNRSTPLSHVGKSPLYFVLLNKFGVSSLVEIFIRAENLVSSAAVSEKQQNDWSNFLVSWTQQMEMASKIATPIELIPSNIFTQHCSRFGNLKADKKLLLEKYFVESSN